MAFNYDPVNHVLSTPEVREMILKKLDTHSLLNCRLVSNSWNSTVSSVLKKRPIWLRRAWGHEEFDHLYNCVASSTDFPFSRLDLSITSKRYPTLNIESASKLFTTFGTTFTHLRAKCSIKWHKEMLGNLLTKTGQLEYLELGRLPEYPKIGNPEFSLSSLRILKFGGIYDGEDENVLEQLIRSAPHLEQIQNLHCGSAVQMAAVRGAGKLHLVSSMTITDSIETWVDSELIGNLPQLTALTVEVNERTTSLFLMALKTLLARNASTLKKLKFCNFPEQLDELPVFHKLEELIFRMDENHGRSAVVPCLSRSLFPKLKKIGLDRADYEIRERFISLNFWEVCEAPFESVDQLELESYCGPDVKKYLAQCFPKVTYISINYKQCNYGSGARHASHIWRVQDFSNLSKLEIRGHPFKYGIMDSFLTGFSKEIVAKLRTAPKQVLTPVISEILRTDENILQLRNLKEFTVAIIRSSSAGKPTNDKPFMTVVSIWYALELIPGLRANFFCCSTGLKRIGDHSKDFQKVFEPIKDCVTIGRCFCDRD